MPRTAENKNSDFVDFDSQVVQFVSDTETGEEPAEPQYSTFTINFVAPHLFIGLADLANHERHYLRVFPFIDTVFFQLQNRRLHC